MKKLLLVSATPFEIEPLLDFLDAYRKGPASFVYNDLHIDICITKVGMVSTAFELGKLINKTYDLAVNAGVAGCFGELALGEVVNVKTDCFSELGAEDDEDFLSIDEMGFGQQQVEVLNPFHNKLIGKLPVVKGITVNTVHGRESSINAIVKALSPDVESMEGAAFLYAANAFGWKALQLRAISNKVERRNKNNWRMALAVKNLNEVLVELIKEFSSH